MTTIDTLPTPRPFYNEFAWAYDQLVVRPVADECVGMVATLARRGIGPGARLLDAGCGNGRYAVELARRGFAVTGVDRSPVLLDEARARVREAGDAIAVRLEAGDLLALPAGPQYDAVVCRGVLNDVVEVAARATIFEVFARGLRPGGVLLFDVRDWAATVAGKTGQPVSEKRVSRHTLTTPTGETTAAFEFVMGCWTRDEVAASLRRAGFEAAEYAATYDGAPLGAGDRIVVAASRGTRPPGSV